MNRVKLSRLYQMVQSPLKLLDTFLFSESFIEKASSFELKSLITSYGISIGIFFDERANIKTRRYLIKYHIACSLFVWACCGFYLANLLTYDFETVVMGVIPMIITTSKAIFLMVVYCLYDVIKQLVEFYIQDDKNFNFSVQSEEQLVEFCIPDDKNLNSSVQSEERKNYIKVKKWVIVVFGIFSGFHICANVFLHFKNDTKMNKITSRPHLMKFFPMWCPFDNWWAKKALWFFQDALILPEAFMFFFGYLAILISVFEMHNKSAMLFAQLKFYSERTFERIEIFDKQLEEAMHISNDRIRSSIIKGLEEEKVNTMDEFYRDFISSLERYQHLQRARVLLKRILDYCCSIIYCLIISMMVGFGFFGTEAFSKVDMEFELISKMSIWFIACAYIWYMICFIGDLFSQQSDLFADEVYSMPWYYFSPKQRKTVFTLLTIIQEPTYLTAMKLVNVKMESFPDFLNSVYSYVQIMRTLQSVKKRNV